MLRWFPLLLEGKKRPKKFPDEIRVLQHTPQHFGSASQKKVLCPEVRQAGSTQWTRQTTHTRPVFTLQDDHTDGVKNTDNVLEIGFLKRANFETHRIPLGALRSLGMYFPLYTQGVTTLACWCDWKDKLLLATPSCHPLWFVDARNFQSDLGFLVCQIGGYKA